MGNAIACGVGDRRSLLNATAQHDGARVEEILKRRPELVGSRAVTEGNGALHMAAASGDLRVCKLLVEGLQEKFGTASRSKNQMHQGKGVWEWRQVLLKTLNRRDGLHMTPLMLACKHGHAAVVAYLLGEGADPFIVDKATQYSCLHLAAYHGHVAVLHALLGPSGIVERAGRRVPLRCAGVDYSGGTCRFIDSRAAHGVTAMHLTAALGHGAAAALLLRLGASMAVRTVGALELAGVEVPVGSTPLHLAGRFGDMVTLQALLQGYLEGQGTPNTQPGERRVDLRRVRDSSRALPYHSAYRTRHRQAAEVLDPRVNLDVALDLCRETSAGVGPQKLSTVCARALRWSHVQWLDEAERQLDEAERAAALRLPRALSLPSPRLAAEAELQFEDVEEQQLEQDRAQANAMSDSPVSSAHMASASEASVDSESGSCPVGSAAAAKRQLARDSAGSLSEGQGPTASTSGRGEGTKASPRGSCKLAQDVHRIASDPLPARVPLLGPTPVPGCESDFTALAGLRTDSCITTSSSFTGEELLKHLQNRPSVTMADTVSVKEKCKDDKSSVEASLLKFRESYQGPGAHGAGSCGCRDAAPAPEDCSICLTDPVCVEANECNHAMCINCARRLCLESQKEPFCPFCRRVISGFHMQQLQSR